MSVLESLPFEISAEILSYLPRTALANVSRLSHQMHAVSQPFLYKSLSLTSSDRPGPSSLHIFLQMLLSPDGDMIATYVRSLHVQLDHEETKLTPESAYDLIGFNAAADSVGLTHSPTSDTGQLVLLLHSLRDLHVLSVSSPDDSTDVFSQIIDTSIGTLATGTHPLILLHLREFQCSNGSVSPNALLAILQLPCIRRVDVHLTEKTGAPLPTIEAAAGSSPVTSLRLTSFKITPSLLKCILAATAALTEFSFSARYPYHVFAISRFGHALQSLKATLQHLDVDLSGVVRMMASHEHGRLFRFGSFHDWQALQTVRCELSTLLGGVVLRHGRRLVDVLPPGLRELDIQGNRFWSVEQEVDLLVEFLREDTVVVGMVKLAVGHGRTGLRSMNRLLVACEAAGVELVDNGNGRGESAVARERRDRAIQSSPRRFCRRW
ncbi:hypothetical protein Q9L58_001492 [Maublancomyces gigas]|uniref:F-box domain-containing protein n=1 Tax=Discina gigas TaxID=1032678 RepID=A0ABR3GU44_9PEZI